MNNTERLTWVELPEHVHHWINTTLGSPVTTARSQTGGFSLGTADRLICANGTRAFLKAVNKTEQEFTAKLHLREGLILKHLPEHAPVPTYIAHFEDDEWAAILTQDIEGAHPRPIWTPEETQKILQALSELSQIRVRDIPDMENTGESLVEELDSWNFINQKSLKSQDFEHQQGQPTYPELLQLLPWANENSAVFAQTVQERYVPLLDGDFLNHTDLRADNILMDDAGRAVIVDWPWASAGTQAFDSAHLFLDIILAHPGVTSDDFLKLVPDSTGLTKDFLLITVLYAAGFYLWAAQFPADSHTGSSLPAQRLYRAVRLLQWCQQNLHSCKLTA